MLLYEKRDRIAYISLNRPEVMNAPSVGATTSSSNGCGSRSSTEEVYLHAYDSVSDARALIARYVAFYNTRRPHRHLDGATPDSVYFTSLPRAAAA